MIESPFAGDRMANLAYLRECLRDSLSRGEAPFASHAIYTRALDDALIDERELGMQAGFVWRQRSMKTAVYTDLGLTEGMRRGIEEAKMLGQPIEYRTIRKSQTLPDKG